MFSMLDFECFDFCFFCTAAFKIIKSWLPAKAVQKIKFVSKSNLKEYVEPEQALKCWGGLDDYTFTFVPEQRSAAQNDDSKKKVKSRSDFVRLGTGSVQVSGLVPKVKIYCRYHHNYLIIFKIHSSCIDTLSSTHRPLVESLLEVCFQNTVESLCHRWLNHLDGVEPMSIELSFHSQKQEKVSWGLSESKTVFTLATWASVRAVVWCRDKLPAFHKHFVPLKNSCVA